ncbi:MAG: 16S rRNA (guanine(527)-N(7))-methyltransferase RsmG [Bacillota bacterium]
MEPLSLFKATLAGWGLELSRTQEDQLAAFSRYLAATGHSFTAIDSPVEVEVKHFLDSASVLLSWDPPGEASVLDVGSGAGFPGIPLKIMRPAIRLGLLDAARKKVEFLRSACEYLGLTGVEFLHGRAEDLGRDPGHRERYDLVVARAVAPAVVLAELCLPLVRRGGFWLAMKGPQGHSELETARGAIALLGGDVERTTPVDLPGGAGSRQLILVRKARPTPAAYPRRAGIPQKRPLKNWL